MLITIVPQNGDHLNITDLFLTNSANLYSSEQVRELDRLAIEEHGIPGLVLMRRAAEATVACAFEYWPSLKSVGIYCGSGNNAGDGYIAAGLFADRGVDVKVVVVGNPGKLGKDATRAMAYCKTSGARFVDSALECDLIVDALLGTGLKGRVRAPYDNVIAEINNCPKPVLAVDIPSGLSADTGVGDAVHADVTITFIGIKRGLLTGAGPSVVGQLEYSDLEVPAEIFTQVKSTVRLLDLKQCQDMLVPRESHAHKTDFGHILLVGGDVGMGGAITMAAEAALRVGAGLVTVATRPENTMPVLARRPEVMGLWGR